MLENVVIEDRTNDGVKCLTLTFYGAANAEDAIVAASIILNKGKSHNSIEAISLNCENKGEEIFYTRLFLHGDAHEVIDILKGHFSSECDVLTAKDAEEHHIAVYVPEILKNAGRASTSLAR